MEKNRRLRAAAAAMLLGWYLRAPPIDVATWQANRNPPMKPMDNGPGWVVDASVFDELIESSLHPPIAAAPSGEAVHRDHAA
jgi:hypothetical protein